LEIIERDTKKECDRYSLVGFDFSFFSHPYLLYLSATSEDSVRFIAASFLHSATVHAEMLLLGTSGMFAAG